MKYSIYICNVFYNEEDNILNRVSDVQLVQVFKDFNSIKEASSFIEFLGQQLSENDYLIVSEDILGNIINLEAVYYHEDGINVLGEPNIYYELFEISQEKDVN